MKTILKIKDAIKYCDYVGYVYPTRGESYYIDSNVPVQLENIDCKDGGFFGHISNEWIRCIRDYTFYSPTLNMIHDRDLEYSLSHNTYEKFE